MKTGSMRWRIELGRSSGRFIYNVLAVLRPAVGVDSKHPAARQRGGDVDLRKFGNGNHNRRDCYGRQMG